MRAPLGGSTHLEPLATPKCAHPGAGAHILTNYNAKMRTPGGGSEHLEPMMSPKCAHRGAGARILNRLRPQN
eukprot:6123582-Karenia_brevis.AAC.1